MTLSEMIFALDRLLSETKARDKGGGLARAGARIGRLASEALVAVLV